MPAKFLQSGYWHAPRCLSVCSYYRSNRSDMYYLPVVDCWASLDSGQSHQRSPWDYNATSLAPGTLRQDDAWIRCENSCFLFSRPYLPPSQPALYYIVGVVNVLTDIATVILAILMMNEVQVSWQNRWLVVSLFAVRLMCARLHISTRCSDQESLLTDR
jgi:hypothetical protein